MTDIKDFEIWREYSKTVSKIENTNRMSFHIKKSTEKYSKKIEKQTNRVPEFILLKKNTKNLKVELLNKQDRRKFRAEATIDLHGHTREIDSILEMFCSKCIVSNLKSIVIISGKGDGILKGAVKNWLETNPRFIIGYFEIKDLKCESGSFGIRLRGK